MKRIVRCLWFWALALALAFPSTSAAGMDSDHLLAVGQQAPSFTFSDIASGAVTPSEGVARGKVLLLVFLQTACQSCYREMMTLKALRAASPDFEVLGIFLDMKAKDFQKYVSENELPFLFGWDAGYAIATAYGVSFTPASFLLDAGRRVVGVYKGFHPGIEQSLKADLARIAKK